MISTVLDGAGLLFDTLGIPELSTFCCVLSPNAQTPPSALSRTATQHSPDRYACIHGLHTREASHARRSPRDRRHWMEAIWTQHGELFAEQRLRPLGQVWAPNVRWGRPTKPRRTWEALHSWPACPLSRLPEGRQQHGRTATVPGNSLCMKGTRTRATLQQQGESCGAGGPGR